MSHQPLRKENNCLNCGSLVPVRFCPVCGQENVITKQSFWGIIRHFIYDIFHFDGKFFETLKPLFLKPGLVAKEYVWGKRIKYLEPIRMYLFTSALFFIVSSYFLGNKAFHMTGNDKLLSTEDRLEAAMTVHEKLQGAPQNPVLNSQLKVLLDSSNLIFVRKLDPKEQADKSLQDSVIEIGHEKYKFESESNDSTELMIKEKVRVSWIQKFLFHIMHSVKTKYGNDLNEASEAFSEKLYHRFPYVLFISLPFFALILKLLYRKNKELYYSDHAVFTLYYYILSFIILLILIGVQQLCRYLHWSAPGWLFLLFIGFWVLSLFLGMKRFYNQGYVRTFIKFLLLNLLAGICTTLIFLITLFISFLFI